MKKPASEALAAAPLPQAGGSYIRLKDGTLQLEETTDNTPEGRAAAETAAVQTPVQPPVQSPVKEA